MRPAPGLRGRLVLLLSAAILLAAVAQAGLVYRLARSQADEVFDYQMRQVAFTLQSVAGPARPEPGFPRRGGDEDFGFVIRVSTTGGQALYQSGPDAALPAAPAPGFSRLAAGRRVYRVFSARTATRIILVAQEMEEREEMAAGMALRAVAPVMLLVPVLMAAVWLVVRRATRPILRVQEQVSSRVAEDLSPLDLAGLPAEVKALVAEMNLLFARLGRAFAAQKDFLADAAHELRTPLAALRLQAQGLQRAGSDEARAVAARRLLEGVDRATRLVEQMLLLARQEGAAAPSLQAGSVALETVAGLAIGDALGPARARRIDLGLAAEPGIVVAGEAEPLRILVRNLVENAVKFAPEAGTVELAIRAEGGRALLTVADSGPGIPPGEASRVFDRFFRLPGPAAAGSGLGLAIVKAIAERHQGQVRLGRSAALGGLEVTVSLPLARVQADQNQGRSPG